MNIRELLNSPIVMLLSHMVALVGLVLACVFYFRSKRDKEPHWAIQTVNLFKDYSGTVAGLEIQYLGEKVRDLSVSKVAFWNHGALTINSNDLVSADPLRLEVKGNGRILSTKLIATNNAACQPLLSAPPERNRAFINFEYLDRGQGFVIQVIHEGTNSTDLGLMGAIKGVANIRQIDLTSFINKTKRERVVSMCQISFVILSMGFLTSLLWTGAWSSWTEGKYFTLALTSTFGGLFFFVTLTGLQQLLSQLNRQVPSGLDSFYSDPRQPATQIAIRLN